MKKKVSTKHHRPKKFMIIAGEASGDLLGASLVDALRMHYPDAIFIGVGGNEMQMRDVVSVFPLEELSLMGIVEVLPHLAHLFRRRDELVSLAEWQNVDMLITIDAPDFCLRVAEKVKQKCDIPCVHYVSPSVWAWRQGRAAKMAKYLDHVLALFPFEPRFYAQYSLPCTYVGHPMVERLSHFEPENLDFPIHDKTPMIGLVPGSRTGVIKRMLPSFVATFRMLKKNMPELRGVLPLSGERHRKLVTDLLGDMASEIDLVESSDRFKALQKCHAALVTSGTSNLEVAMIGTPMVVGYKMGALTHFIAKMMVKIPYASPVNWVAGKKIVQEFIQDDCNPENLYQAVKPLMLDTDLRQLHVQDLKEMREKFKNNGEEKAAPSDIAAKVIQEILESRS